MSSKALQYLNSFDLFKVDLRLDRIKAFLREMGNPEQFLKYVHVAGTNGKGSVCAYISSALKEAGYKTGLYLSPHLHKFNERIQINGKMIQDRDLERIILELKEVKQESKIDVSYFEFVTALAFKYFYEKKCDFVVLEVGMGGRLDATNVVIPEISVITSIALEHKKYLGESLEEIAFEKSGIVKKGIPVVSAEQNEKALEVIERKCMEKKAPLSVLSRDFSYVKHNATLKGQVFDYNSGKHSIKGLKTRLLGEHQLVNASVAVRALLELGIEEKAIRKGLEEAFLPGRFQLIHNNPAIIADVAHNPNGAFALRKSIQEFFPEKKALFVLGVSEDKDIKAIVKELSLVADSFICTQAKFRGMNAERIKQAIAENGFKGCIQLMPSVRKAVESALNQKKPLTIFTGSFYSVGEAMEFLNNN